MSEVAEERTAASTRAPSLEGETKEFETDVKGTKTGDAEAQVAPAPKPDFPEGGLRGWATVAGACVLSLLIIRLWYLTAV